MTEEPNTAATNALKSANERMHNEMDIDRIGNPDRDFVCAMIPHHQGAVGMARVALDHCSRPELRGLADRIIADQNKEIADMRDWLARMNLRTVAVAALALAASSPALAGERTPLPLPGGCDVANAAASPLSASAPSFPPVQLQMRTPVEPTIFAAGGYNYLLYELHLQNFADEPLALRRLEVFDPDNRNLIASFEGAALSKRLVGVGAPLPDSDQSLQPGRGAVAFICLAWSSGTAPSARLSHRLVFDDSMAEGPTIATRNSKVKVLAPPVSGADWMAVSGLSFGAHHRSGLFVAGGLAQISRRYAVDWKRQKLGAFFSGDPRNVNSYHTYGQDVFAVADARVVLATDGLPDNIPRTPTGFSTALPVTMDTVAGNSVVLDLGDGQFAYYAHLKPGSVRVKVGDQVRRGQRLGSIGNSGDSREPHLHFQVATTPQILASEGLPYVINRFRVTTTDGISEDRNDEFPLGNMLIDFGSGKPRPAQDR